MKKLAYFLILLSFLFSSCKSKKTLVVSPAYPVLAVDSLRPDTGGFISGLFAPDHSQLKELQRTQKQKKKQQVKSASHNSPVPAGVAPGTLITHSNISVSSVYKGIDRDMLRENMRYFLSAIMPVCEEYGVNMCVHPDDPPFQVLGLPRIVTNEADIAWFLNAVDNPHNGLTFCAGSLSAGEHNDTRELAKKFAKRTHFVHLRSTAAMPGGNFIESSHLTGRGHLIDLIRIFEKENPGLPMRVDHGRMMLGDEDKGYNPGYSFHGRMLALAQVEGMMAVVQDEINN